MAETRSPRPSGFLFAWPRPSSRCFLLLASSTTRLDAHLDLSRLATTAAEAMTLRPPYRPLRPDLDKFLFATVGDEIDGVPLSVVSALVRLGLDPWNEASRLSSLSNREAVEQLARLIAELPGLVRPMGEARDIAGSLIKLLPKHDPTVPRGSPIQRPSWPRVSRLWVACFVLAAAVLVLRIVMHSGFPFGIGGP